MYITLKSIFLNVLQLKQKRAARFHVQLPDLDDEDQTNLVAPTLEAEEVFSAADASLEGPDVTPPIVFRPAPYTRPPLVRDPKRAKVIDTAPDEGIQALVHCSQQLVEVGDKLARTFDQRVQPRSVRGNTLPRCVRTFLDSCLRTCTWRHRTVFGLFCKMFSEMPIHAVTLTLHPNPKLQLQTVAGHTSNHSGSLIPHSGPATHLQPAFGVPWGASSISVCPR